MQLIDTHCHIDLYPNYKDVICETEATQILTIAVTNIPSVYSKCASLVQGTKFLKPALGLHPQLVMQRKNEFSLFKKLLPQTQFVGEVGLDFSTNNNDDRAIQKQFFGLILKECAFHGNKVITVHSRRSSLEVVEMIGNNYPGTVILHWFSGPLKVLDQAIKYGCYFSVNSAMLTSETGRRILKTLPSERVLTETDGPFVQIKGESARPSNISQIVVDIAKFWNLDFEMTSQIISANFFRAIKLNESNKNQNDLY